LLFHVRQTQVVDADDGHCALAHLLLLRTSDHGDTVANFHAQRIGKTFANQDAIKVITGDIATFLDRLGQESSVINAMKSALPSYEIESFQANYPELASTINTKTGVMNIFSVIIIAIAGVGILNLLLMAVYERTREIGVLGAMGLKPNQISILFILEGTMIGLVGAAAGVVLGLAINGYLMKVGLDFGNISSAASYMALVQSRIYPTWGIEMLPLRVSMILIISALAALIPATEAGRREPAEALHFV